MIAGDFVASASSKDKWKSSHKKTPKEILEDIESCSKMIVALMHDEKRQWIGEFAFVGIEPVILGCSLRALSLESFGDRGSYHTNGVGIL